MPLPVNFPMAEAKARAERPAGFSFVGTARSIWLIDIPGLQAA